MHYLNKANLNNTKRRKPTPCSRNGGINYVLHGPEQGVTHGPVRAHTVTCPGKSTYFSVSTPVSSSVRAIDGSTTTVWGATFRILVTRNCCRLRDRGAVGIWVASPGCRREHCIQHGRTHCSHLQNHLHNPDRVCIMHMNSIGAVQNHPQHNYEVVDSVIHKQRCLNLGRGMRHSICGSS
jgi:hypothetical protein